MFPNASKFIGCANSKPAFIKSCKGTNSAFSLFVLGFLLNLLKGTINIPFLLLLSNAFLPVLTTYSSPDLFKNYTCDIAVRWLNY